MMFLFTWVVPPAMVWERAATRSRPQRSAVGVGSEHVAGDLGDELLGLAPDKLGDAAFGAEGPAVELARDRPVGDQLQQLGVEVGAGEPWRGAQGRRWPCGRSREGCGGRVEEPPDLRP